VTGHPNAEALLAELNREFVLLDGQTFQSFMDETAINRGRSFSGLLGLARYSALRQQLQQLCQTRSFNSHFDTSAQTAKKASADRAINAARTAIATDYEVLVQGKIGSQTTSADAQARCHASLKAIPTLREADHQLVRHLRAISSGFRGRRTAIENEKLLIAECEPCHLGHAEPRMCAK
jgi:hypothetical protein